MALLPMLIQHLMTRGMRQEQKETHDLQQEFLKGQIKQQSQNFKEKQQMIDYINALPREQQNLVRTNPKVAGLLMFLTNRGQEGQAQQPPGGYLPPTEGGIGGGHETPQAPQPPGGLSGQIAGGQLFGGMKPEQMLEDYIRKETGIGESMQPVRTGPMIDPTTRQLVESQALRGGGVRPLMGPQGERIPAREEVRWIETVDEDGNPIKVPVPAKMLPGEGLGLRQPVKPETRRKVGPMGEITEERLQPYTGEVISKTPVGAPKGKPAETAGRLSLVAGGIKELENLKNLVFNKDGTVNRTNLANAYIGTPWTKGRTIKNMLFRIIDPIMRAATGAAVPEDELRRYVASYSPTIAASDEEIGQTWEALGDFLRDYLTISDPTGELSKKLGAFDKAMELPRRGMEKRPSKVIRFKKGEHEYDIPMDKVNEFMKAFPNAQRVNQ